MKNGYQKIGILVLLVGLFTSFTVTSYASDWDKAGKALTITEGLRFVTGGRVDVIGSISGFGRNGRRSGYNHHSRYNHRQHRDYCDVRVWVPHYGWKTKYIPAHEEYDPKCHKRIFVAGQYIRYMVENGGHWETRCG